MRIIISVLFLLGLLSCKQEETSKNSNKMEEKIVDYAFTCNLVNEPERIEEYRHFHSEEGVWPEVIETFEASGASSVKIFIQETRLVLIISLPESISFEEFSRIYASTSERIKDWDAKMASYQLPPPGGEEGETWVAMETMFEFQKQ